MSQKIDVAEVAEQARIALTPEEKDTCQRQLESILSYAERIGERIWTGLSRHCTATRVSMCSVMTWWCLRSGATAF